MKQGEEKVTASNRLQEKLSAPDVEESPTPYQAVELKTLATCHRCSRKGHFAAVCFSRTIVVVSQEELEPAETSNLDVITNRGNR